ncbi:hypothetical protein ACFQZS_00390 [Mucilaginibacter calamicampi]|uniref:FG-GAP repeat-containing protein n=1 Tax=Mucilaginibacter calamicampi TaxID=1302352 RepID=A0ABW2YQI3_9SPHI
MKTACITYFMIFISNLVAGQSKLPKEFDSAFKRLNLSVKYQPVAFLKTSYLQSDFNKDGIKDMAALIIKKTTKKRGVLLIHGGSNQYFVFGAGNKFGSGSDDFKWMRGWSLFKDKTAYETTFSKDGDILGSKKIQLVRPAIYVHDVEDGSQTAGGLIYWNGKKYIWIHQGE